MRLCAVAVVVSEPRAAVEAVKGRGRKAAVEPVKGREWKAPLGASARPKMRAQSTLMILHTCE